MEKIKIEIDEEILNEAIGVLNSLGLDLDGAINIFLKQVILNGERLMVDLIQNKTRKTKEKKPKSLPIHPDQCQLIYDEIIEENERTEN